MKNLSGFLLLFILIFSLYEIGLCFSNKPTKLDKTNDIQHFNAINSNHNSFQFVSNRLNSLIQKSSDNCYKVDSISSMYVNYIPVFDSILLMADTIKMDNSKKVRYTFQNGTNDSCFIYKFDEFGNQTLSLKKKWDNDIHTWIEINKLEKKYDNQNRLVELIFYENINNENIEPFTKQTLEHIDGAHYVHKFYNWNKQEQEFTFSNENNCFHRKSYNEFEQIIEEVYIEFVNDFGSEERIHWVKHYDYNNQQLLISEKFKDELSGFNWYNWSSHFDYDNNGNLVYYRSEAFDTITSRNKLTNEGHYSYNGKNKIVNHINYIRVDSLDELILEFDKTYIYDEKDSLKKILEFMDLPLEGDHPQYISYYELKEDNIIIKKYGYRYIESIPKEPELHGSVFAFEYDTTINNYTKVKVKGTPSSPFKLRSEYEYDNNNRIVSFIDEREKYEYFYDRNGRDSLWNIFYESNNNWDLEYQVKFEFEKPNDSIILRYEKWFYDSDYPEFVNTITYTNNQITEFISDEYAGAKPVVSESDTIKIKYNSNGQILSIFGFGYTDEGYFLSDNINSIYNLDKNRLTILTNIFSVEENEWQTTSIQEVDLSNNQNETIHALPVFWERDNYPSIVQSLIYGGFSYGKNHNMSFYQVKNGTKDKKMGSWHFHYSPTTKLIGSGLISGQIFKSEGSGTTEIHTTTEIFEGIYSGIIVNLIDELDNEIIASTTTNDNGVFCFKSIPNGRFTLEVIKEDFTQKNTYNIEMSEYEKSFNNLNFLIFKGNTSSNTFENEIHVFPIPTKELIQIDGLPQNEITLITVYDVLGQKLKQLEVQKKNTSIDLSNFKKGTYYLNFNGNTNSSVKIIKE